jgi:hypothetical protein
VAGLLTVFFVALLQLALSLHVRNTLVDCASDGARYGGLVGHTATDARERTEELISTAVSPRYADDVAASVTSVDGVAVVEVRVRAPLPVIGLLGVGGQLTVTGHGLVEG